MATKTVNVTLSTVLNIVVNSDNPALSDAQAETEALRLAQSTPAYQYLTKSPHQGRGEVTLSASV